LRWRENIFFQAKEFQDNERRLLPGKPFLQHRLQ
jgi:hypothetical protein